MNQKDRLTYLVDYLVEEYTHSDWSTQNFNLDPFSEDLVKIGKKPYSYDEMQRLFQELLTIRPPRELPKKFIATQDAYLQEELQAKSIVEIDNLQPIATQLYLWKGDITKLKVDAIVNAANPKMLGCWIPGHTCIDNEIHTNAGVQLRLENHKVMREQGFEEPTGSAKITSAYNLPARFIIHTVGPNVTGEVTQIKRELLQSSYLSCLKLADENELKEIAFCCISTGEFAFPNEEAAEIAIETVRNYLDETETPLKVIFNVFTDKDHSIYEKQLNTLTN